MVSLWSWGNLSAPMVGQMAEKLHQDVRTALEGNLDLQVLEEFAKVGQVGHTHANKQLEALLSKTNMPKMAMEKMSIKNGLLVEDSMFMFMFMFMQGSMPMLISMFIHRPSFGYGGAK